LAELSSADLWLAFRDDISKYLTYHESFGFCTVYPILMSSHEVPNLSSSVDRHPFFIVEILILESLRWFFRDENLRMDYL